MGKSKIVTPEVIQQMRDFLAQIDQQKREIELAERAGLDVSAAKQQLNEAEKAARNIVQTYG